MPNAAKLYLHFEGRPEFTQIVKKQPDEARTAGDLCRTFAQAYTNKHEADRLEASLIHIFTERGRVLASSDSIASLFGQGDVFVKQADVVRTATSAASRAAAPIAVKLPSPEPKTPACSTPATCLSTKDEEDIRRALPHSGRACQLLLDAEQLTKLSNCHSSTLPEQALAQLVSPYLLRAEEAEQQKLYKIAATIYEQVLGQAVSLLMIHSGLLLGRSWSFTRDNIWLMHVCCIVHRLCGSFPTTSKLC